MCTIKQQTQNFLALRFPISFSQMRNELGGKDKTYF